MIEIKVILSKDSNKSTVVNINQENIPAMDLPYFVEMEKQNSGKRKIDFQFLNNTETKDCYEDDYLKFVFGKKSGKIYEFELNENAYINSNKLKLIRNDIFEINENHRFKNNMTNCLHIIKIIIDNDDFK